MTRRSLKRTLRWSYFWLAVVLVISLIAKLANFVPGLSGTNFVPIANDVYAYLRDMALVFVTVVAAYLANVFQKRSNFVSGLREEWRNIVATKCAAVTFCETHFPTTDDYLEAYARLSATIDTMRIIYRNTGETNALIGLYPYEPLHDMRRVIQSLDPRGRGSIPSTDRKLAAAAIVQSFNALRETFLEELDLEEPTRPILRAGSQRIKQRGALQRAYGTLEAQRRVQQHIQPTPTACDELLADLHANETVDARITVPRKT